MNEVQKLTLRNEGNTPVLVTSVQTSLVAWAGPAQVMQPGETLTLTLELEKPKSHVHTARCWRTEDYPGTEPILICGLKGEE